MITNRRQLEITRRKFRELSDYASDLKETIVDRESRGLDVGASSAELDSVISVADSLGVEIDEFVALEGSNPVKIRVADLAEVPVGLIKARIASGLTQGRLAERLGLAESAIQRYEQQKYRGASWERLAEVQEAIGIPIEVGPPGPSSVGMSPRAESHSSLSESASKWLGLPTGEAVTFDPSRLGLAAVVQSALDLLTRCVQELTDVESVVGGRDPEEYLVNRQVFDADSFVISPAHFRSVKHPGLFAERSPADSASSVVQAIALLTGLQAAEPRLLDKREMEESRAEVAKLRDRLDELSKVVVELDDGYLGAMATSGRINLEDKVNGLRNAISTLDHVLYDASLAVDYVAP